MSEPTMQPALQPGDKVGYYQVQAPIGAGGMSLVWQGFDQLMNRQVAIKQIADIASTDEEMRTKMKQEANIHKQVSAGCANIVDIIELIEEDRGIFLIMEFVDGLNLESILAKKAEPLPPAQVLPIVHQIAVALHHIHQAGIIHRDMKPANILMNRNGEVKVTDFGIATMIDDQENMNMGTARYMAPELFTSNTADTRADMYSLGFIAYEMLAGRAKFEESFKSILRDPRSQALRWMKWHTNARLAPPELTGLSAQVSPQLAELVQRMMNKDHNQRIPDMATLNQVLVQNFSAEAQARQAQQEQAMAAQQQMKEEQMVQASANPTAALPQKSRKGLYIGAGVGGFLFIVCLIVATIFSGGDDFDKDKFIDELSVKSSQTWQAIELESATLEDGTLESTQAVLDSSRKQLVDKDLKALAPNLFYYTQARAAAIEMRINQLKGINEVEALNFTEAQQYFRTAEDSSIAAADAEDIRLGYINQADIANEFIDRMKQIRDGITKARRFAGISEKVVDLINKGDYTDAASMIERMPEFAQRALSDTELAIQKRLTTRLEFAVSDKSIQDLVDRANAFIAQGKKQEFINFVSGLVDKYPDFKSDTRMVNLVTQSRQYSSEIHFSAQHGAAVARFNDANKKASDAFLRTVNGTISARIITEAESAINESVTALEGAKRLLGNDMPPAFSKSTFTSDIDGKIETMDKSLAKLDAITSDDVDKMQAFVDEWGADSDIQKMINDYEANKEVRAIVARVKEITTEPNPNTVIKEMPGALAKLPDEAQYQPVRAAALRALDRARLTIAENKAGGIDPSKLDAMGDVAKWQQLRQNWETVLQEGPSTTADSMIALANAVLSVQTKVKDLEAQMESSKTRRAATLALRTFKADEIQSVADLKPEQVKKFEAHVDHIAQIRDFYFIYQAAEGFAQNTEDINQLTKAKEQAQGALAKAPADKHRKKVTDLLAQIERSVKALENR